MLCQNLETFEKKFFRTLNRYLEPLIEAGVGSPGLVPVGTVVLETIGRRSGRTYQIPVVASEISNLLVVSTVRGRSQWVKNVAAKPHIQVWLRGRLRPATAYVVGAAQTTDEELPPPSPLAQKLIEILKPISRLTGSSFAVLSLPASA